MNAFVAKAVTLAWIHNSALSGLNNLSLFHSFSCVVPYSQTLLVVQSVPPKRRGRKRQLIFADQSTQISQDAMRQQTNNPLIETQSLVGALW